jgi:predicted branched-subunit amino acid permease
VTESGYREGAHLAAPIAIAVLAFGATFGVLARAAGMGIAAPLVTVDARPCLRLAHERA